MSLGASGKSLISRAVSSLLAENGDVFFVQVGGFDGESFDPLRGKIIEGGMKGLIIEPLPDNFAKLQALYAGSETIRPICCAISEEDGQRTIYRFGERAFCDHDLPQMFAGISSFILDDLLRETGTLGQLFSSGERDLLHSLIDAVPVPCRCFETLFREQGVEKVDLLQIDTEGYDYELLKSFDIARYRPAIINYENQHLSKDDKRAAEDMLAAHGYLFYADNYDTLAILPDLVSL